jgi:hypothetical protein
VSPAALPPVILAPWLPLDQPHRAIAENAIGAVGVCEDPLGSNRGAQIDAWLRRAKVPESLIQSGKGYWCGAAAGAWWLDAGYDVPVAYASCDAWMAWAKRTGRWSKTPIPGAAVLYGTPSDANHIGVVVCTAPLLLAIEGNTSVGGQFSRNGVAVDLKEVNRQRLLGFVHPLPLSRQDA